MQKIPLSTRLTTKNGALKLYAQVDDEDYDYLMQWKWSASKDGNTFYALSKDSEGRRIIMHRVVMGLKRFDGKIVDHKDGDGLNNTRSNLRIASPSENNKNKRSRVKGASPFLGVFIKNNKRKVGTHKAWRSAIKTDTEYIHLGTFSYTPEGEIAAAKCYDEAAKKYHGEFAKLNFKN